MGEPEYRVELSWRDGREESVTVASDETILDGADAADVALPFGCRTGACATCTARLLSGEIEHVRPPRGLKLRHLADGYLLTCIATPRADCRLEVGADVASDLVSNPWQ